MDSLIKIYFNPLDAKSCTEYPVQSGTRIIDFLQKEYPDGFDGYIRILIGNQEIAIDDIDRVINPEEQIIILVMPGSFAAPALPYIITALVSTAIGFVINYIFAPKTPSGNLNDEESVVYSLNPTRNAVRLGEPIEVFYGQCSFPPSYASAPYSFFFQGSNDQYVDQLLCIGAGQYTVEDVFVGDTPINAFEPGSVKYWVFLPGEHNERLGNIEQAVNAETAGSECPWLFSENVYTSPEVSDVVFNRDVSEATLSGGLSAQVYAGTTDPVTGVQTLDRIEGFQPASTVSIREGDTFSITGSTLNDVTFVVGSLVPSETNPAEVTIFPRWSDFGIFTDETLTDPPVTYSVNTTNDNISAGPYRCQKLGREVYRIDVDFVFPRGLHRTDGSTGKTKYHAISFRFTYQMVDEVTGLPIGDPIIKDELFHEKRRDVIRATITSGVIPVGVYEVTVERTAGVPVPDNDDQTQTSLPDDDTRKVEETQWTALKGYIQHDRTIPAYGRCTLMALRIKATNAIGQAAQNRIRVRATRRGFNEDSSNPAVVIEDIWTDSDYGLGRSLEEFDTAKLAQLESLWKAAGAKFNGVFDKRSTGFEAMDSVCSLMGAKVVQDGGLTTIVQDMLQPVRAAMFSSANIIRGSLRIDYTFNTDDDFDSVETSYRDPLTFDEKFALAPPDGLQPEKHQLFGCTDADYAQRMAQYLWNVKTRRRKKAIFDTELEGLLPRFGDRIGVSHPMPDYGQSGVFISNISADTWKVDQPLDWDVNKQNYMIVRDQYGVPSESLRVSQGGARDEVVFVDTPPAIFTPNDGQDPSSYAFGLVYDLIRDFMITKTSPRSDTTVQIEAQVYDEDVYVGAPRQMNGGVITYCERFGIVEDLLVQTQTVIRSENSDGGKINGVVGQLQYDSLLAVDNDNVYWTKQVAGTLAPQDRMKNDLRYSNDFGQTWQTVARVKDEWTDSVWPDYSINSYWLNGTYLNLDIVNGNVFYNYSHSDAGKSTFWRVPAGAGSADNELTCVWSCYGHTRTGAISYTGLYNKPSNPVFVNWSVGGAITGGNLYLYSGVIYPDWSTVRNDTSVGGKSNPDEDITNNPVNGSVYEGPVTIPRWIQDDSSSTSPPPSLTCYQVYQLGGLILYSAATDKYWSYDTINVEAVPKGKYKKLDTSSVFGGGYGSAGVEFSTNSNQWLPYETSYPWAYTKLDDGVTTDRNATLYTDASATWGWLTQSREGYSSSVLMPLSGVEGTGVNQGKYRRWDAVLDDSADKTWEQWLEIIKDGELGDAENLPVWNYSQTDLDFSSLLVPLDPNETTLDTFRIWQDANYPGERYVMIYAFNNTNYSDGFPLRFYMRVASDCLPEKFSEPVTVNNPDISTNGWTNAQLAARSKGGWRIQYSKSQAKFVTATIYLTAPGTYKEVVSVFDDPFACEAFGQVSPQ